ncbi:MAG: hypothetical protein Q9219_005295 [cf. Caloplaca sp. 3 TL-2023]
MAAAGGSSILVLDLLHTVPYRQGTTLALTMGSPNLATGPAESFTVLIRYGTASEQIEKVEKDTRQHVEKHKEAIDRSHSNGLHQAKKQHQQELEETSRQLSAAKNENSLREEAVKQMVKHLRQEQKIFLIKSMSKAFQRQVKELEEENQRLQQEEEAKSHIWTTEKAEMKAQIVPVSHAASLPPSPPPFWLLFSCHSAFLANPKPLRMSKASLSHLPHLLHLGLMRHLPFHTPKTVEHL